MERVEEAREFLQGRYSRVRENYSDLVLLTFVISTGLMFYQHSQGWSWDFKVYSLIGSYIFHEGIYMEWLRPPVASVFMGLLQYLLSRSLAEYAFVGLSSTFFLYASKRLSGELDFSHEAFYVFLLTPAAIFFSSINGTEMLSLAFVMMFAADFRRPRSGLWLGLAFLTRYNFGMIIPLVLLQKKPLKIIKTGIISGLTLVPWLLYNEMVTGNFFTSFGNFLMLNVFLRYAQTPLDPQNLLIITLPAFLALGLYIKPEVREKISMNTMNLFMTAYSVLILISYLTADYRSLRYLYPMILPVAFFAAKIWKEVETGNVLKFVLAINLVCGGIWMTQTDLTDPEKFQEAAEIAEGCMVETDAWPMANYAGVPAVPDSNPSITENRLRKGYRTVIFGDPLYKNFSGPVIERTEDFTVYGYENLCKEPVKADQTYIQRFNERTGLNYSFRSYVYHRFVKDKLEVILK